MVQPPRVGDWLPSADSAFRTANRALQWARVVDAHDGRVSLTSLAFGATVAAATAAPSWPSIVALLVAAGLYGHRRHVAGRLEHRDETLRALAEQVAVMGEKLAEEQRQGRALRERVTEMNNRLPSGRR